MNSFYLKAKSVICFLIASSVLSSNANQVNRDIASESPTGLATQQINPDIPLFDEDSFTTSTIFIVTSNFMSRGISASLNQPAVQGMLSLSHKSGISAGTFLSSHNSVVGGGQSDLYLSYAQQVGGIYFVLTEFWYSFPNMPTINATDTLLSAYFNSYKIQASYMPSYFGAKSIATYIAIAKETKLTKKHNLNVNFGYSDFQKPDNVGFKNYYDYKFGVTTAIDHGNFEFFWSDTNRQDLNNNKINDATSGVAITLSY